MKTNPTCLLLVVVLAISSVQGQQAQAPLKERPFTVIKVDPGLDEIVSPDVKLEVLGEHLGLSEGPVWIQDGGNGYLLFSDCAANVIYKWMPQGSLSVFLENAGYTGKDNLNVGQQTISGGRVAILLIGPNGLTLDAQGRLVICAMADRTVVRLEKDGKRTLLADRYEGKRFSGPNDVIVKSNGDVYFTDSINGLRGGSEGPVRELPFNGFFLVQDGKVTLLGGDKDQPGDWPNGIAFSPDEKYLYVSSGMRQVMRYDVKTDGTVANRQVFIPDAGSDGMKVDRKGNLYTTTGGGVRITSPEGKHLGTLQLPIIVKEPRPRICATNVAFGDADSKGLYVTACSDVFRVQLKVPGIRPGPKR